MDFYQCENARDCEKYLDIKKAAFVSNDFRVYEEIEFWDEHSIWHIPAKTILALYNMQSQIELMTDEGQEQAFDQVLRTAKELEDAFKEVLKEVGYAPITKKKR